MQKMRKNQKEVQTNQKLTQNSAYSRRAFNSSDEIFHPKKTYEDFAEPAITRM